MLLDSESELVRRICVWAVTMLLNLNSAFAPTSTQKCRQVNFNTYELNINCWQYIDPFWWHHVFTVLMLSRWDMWTFTLSTFKSHFNTCSDCFSPSRIWFYDWSSELCCYLPSLFCISTLLICILILLLWLWGDLLKGVYKKKKKSIIIIISTPAALNDYPSTWSQAEAQLCARPHWPASVLDWEPSPTAAAASAGNTPEHGNVREFRGFFFCFWQVSALDLWTFFISLRCCHLATKLTLGKQHPVVISFW